LEGIHVFLRLGNMLIKSATSSLIQQTANRLVTIYEEGLWWRWKV